MRLKKPDTNGSKQGALAHAEQLMARHLEERGTSVRPIFLPLCQTYMLVLGDNGLWQKAIDYFWNLVSKKNPMPDTACYDAALMACRRQGRYVLRYVYIYISPMCIYMLLPPCFVCIFEEERKRQTGEHEDGDKKDRLEQRWTKTYRERRREKYIMKEGGGEMEI